MMKKLLFIYSLLFFLKSEAQIPNPSFEQWDYNFGYSAFTNWNSHIEFHTQISNSHEGSYALNIGMYKYSFSPVVINLPILTGIPSNSFIPISTRPTKFFGWYGINGGSGIDTVAFIVKLKKSGNLIGAGQFTATSFQFTYTQFSTSIVYTSSDMPDSVSISLGFKTNLSEYANCFIDDLSFDQTVDIKENNFLKPEIIVFPNPTQNKLTFLNQNISSNRIVEIEIQSLSNQLICKKLFASGDHVEIDIQDLENGFYFIKIRFDKGNCLLRKVLKD